MGVDFAQTKAQRSPHNSNRAKVAPDCHSMCPRARRRRHMVKIGTLSHRGSSPSAIVNRTPRVAMCANFAQTKAQGSPRTLSRTMVALDRRSMGPRARSRRNMVRIGTPLTSWFQPMKHRISHLQSHHQRQFRPNESLLYLPYLARWHGSLKIVIPWTLGQEVGATWSGSAPLTHLGFSPSAIENLAPEPPPALISLKDSPNTARIPCSNPQGRPR